VLSQRRVARRALVVRRRPPHPPVMQDGPSLTRRSALAAIGSAAAASIPGCATEAKPSHAKDAIMKPSGSRMPVVYIPHGGGPWPFVDLGFGDPAELEKLATHLRSLPSMTPTKPRALLVISAHWEERAPTVMTGEKPPLLFDYYGFPPESYKLTWPAPGDPALAARVRALLEGAGLSTAEDAQRGFDHGTFVPLKLAYPAAEIPTVQLSLKRGLDPAEHLAIGRAIAPLRDEGVLIIGSGMSYHNLRAFGPAGRAPSAAFDAWLNDAIAQDPEERARRLTAWSRAPSARAAHPREEHLLPLMVVAGAAGADRGAVAYSGTLMGLRLSGHAFG
jgi:aromatic ring-opening dioxygenase catalytic subunit (LigB family)